MISFIEERAVKHNHLMRNIRSSPMAFKTDSSSSAEGAVMLTANNNKNGKNVKKEDAIKANCTFCSLLPENGSFKNINPDNHSDSNCFKRNAHVKEDSSNKKRSGDDGNRNGSVNRNTRPMNEDKGRVFISQNAQFDDDDSDNGVSYISEEDALVLTAQNTLRGINNPELYSFVVDTACDKNMIKDKELFIGEMFNLSRPVKMRGVGNGTVTATKGGDTIFGTAIFTPEVGYNLLSHPQLIREGAIDATRITYIAPKFQGGLDSLLYPDIYGVMREFAPIANIAVASNLYQHVIKVEQRKQAARQMA